MLFALTPSEHRAFPETWLRLRPRLRVRLRPRLRVRLLLRLRLRLWEEKKIYMFYYSVTPSACVASSSC